MIKTPRYYWRKIKRLDLGTRGLKALGLGNLKLQRQLHRDSANARMPSHSI
jgi:hypothetical protein